MSNLVCKTIKGIINFEISKVFARITFMLFYLVYDESTLVEIDFSIKF